MKFKYPPVAVNVWGDFACFTRPEMKVERMSYRCMTPSAARGILEAIFWKPEFTWIIKSIEILNPIRQIAIRRNEVKNKVPAGSISTWRKEKKHDRFFADEDRTQRNTIALKDVNYVIKANVLLREHAKETHPAKYRDQFRRRVKNGKCYTRPYLGCREFAAYFNEPQENYETVDLTEDLGRVLFDIDYNDKNERAVPHFFQAKIIDGVLEIPVDKYREIRGL